MFEQETNHQIRVSEPEPDRAVFGIVASLTLVLGGLACADTLPSLLWGYGDYGDMKCHESESKACIHLPLQLEVLGFLVLCVFFFGHCGSAHAGRMRSRQC